MEPGIGSAAWDPWWSIPIAHKHPLPGHPDSVAAWAWELHRFGFEVQLRLCLAAAQEVLPIWQRYRPLANEADLAAEAIPSEAISLAVQRLGGTPHDEAAARCAAQAIALARRTWMNADECAHNPSSPVSMDEMARAAEVFSALARAVAWTPEGARARALPGEEDDAAAVGPADCCVAAVTRLMDLTGRDFDAARRRLLSRVAEAPAGHPGA